MGCCLSQQEEDEDMAPLCQNFSGSTSTSTDSSSTRSTSPVRASPSPGTPLLFSDDGSSDPGYYTPEELLSV